jgi:succinate dehydrogenase/fumarate reductase iron-sulfur protein
MSPKSGLTRSYRFEIFRYSAAGGSPPRFQSYEFTADKNMSVLEAILKIQDEQDPTLAFRYACRGAVCGSCAMSINGSLNLACRVQLQAIPTARIVLEPLPGLEIVKDLVVDMDPFWAKYERVRPWLHAEISSATENRMSQRQRERIDQFTHCILCGLCYAACPATRSNDDFAGPAALAKLHRFLADSREDRNGEAQGEADSADGAWGCRTVMRCCDVCPKEVRPSDGIRAVRRGLLAHKFKGLLRRKTT